MISWIHSKLEQYKVDKKKSNRIELALEEALVNVISYAYSKDAGPLEIRVAYFEENRILEFTILDQGKAFNPLEYKELDISSDLEHRAPGGLGIYFLKQISHELTYLRQGNSNILSIKHQI